MLLAKRDRGITDMNYVDHPEAPFVVIREATFEEWLKEANEDGLDISEIQRAYAKKYGHFYEVSVD